MAINLFDKYDTPVPRYTSYPSVPNWKDNLTTREWLSHLKKAFSRDLSWSIYMHLPFCESLCTFCGCSQIITRDHSKEDQYIEALHKEWKLYLNALPELSTKKIRQIHLGGGSPTFFNASNLKKLLVPFFDTLTIDPKEFEGAVEVDPRRCTWDQLKTLREIGFNRISLGVQDFDLEVQKNVNRIQPYEMVERCVTQARELGYESVNFDLIYGLPGQTEQSVRDTAIKTMQLQPDRIAFYSLAVVPWLRPAQNRFKKMEIRKGAQKRELFDVASKVFLDHGYVPLGIDHFARPADSISLAYQTGTMHRNFMGYTEYATDVLLGLGMTSISESPDSFHQNLKAVSDYYQSVEEGKIPTLKGHVLTKEDMIYKEHILNLMTQYRANVEGLNANEFQELLEDGLIEIHGDDLQITEKGLPFTRHVCQKVDRYSSSVTVENKFSSGV